MALLTVGDADVIKGRLHFPQRGAWLAWLLLDTTAVPSGQVKLAADGGLSATGTVKSAGVFLDSVALRLVGGAGGLGTIIPPAAYENGQLSDPLNAIMNASGESLSSTVDSSITSVQLTRWTHVAQSASAALDRLAFAAGQALGSTIVWRVLSDGTVWLGAESWPSQDLPAGSDLLKQYPDEGRFEIGAQTPSLLPGVNVPGIGNVAAVDHWIAPRSIRSDAWLA
jgi:hypothetical protein